MQKPSKGEFSNNKGKFNKKLASGKTRTLSITGKIVLIKSNLGGIAQYLMKWFTFLKYICNDINNINTDFFMEQ